MNTGNHKPVSESARMSVEKAFHCKAFAGMKAKKCYVIDPFCL